MKINEISSSVRQKAGVIPYFIGADGRPTMMFMTPSNAAYGGNRPQIAKGGVEPGEDLQEAALREAEEELGLIASNVTTVKKLSTQTITGLDDTYSLTVFVVQVKNSRAFNKPHYETGATHWLTAEEFAIKGRQNQLGLVRQAASLL